MAQKEAPPALLVWLLFETQLRVNGALLMRVEDIVSSRLQKKHERDGFATVVPHSSARFLVTITGEQDLNIVLYLPRHQGRLRETAAESVLVESAIFQASLSVSSSHRRSWSGNVVSVRLCTHNAMEEPATIG